MSEEIENIENKLLDKFIKGMEIIIRDTFKEKELVSKLVDEVNKEKEVFVKEFEEKYMTNLKRDVFTLNANYSEVFLATGGNRPSNQICKVVDLKFDDFIIRISICNMNK